MKNGIFVVDVKGLRQLKAGKPKWFIIRELLQNALDEEISTCSVVLQYEGGKAQITVEDDSPTGFRDLADAYTLFKDTYKRGDVSKRGRFNMGEKEVLCLADYARIITTTGGIEFDIIGGKRTTLRRKREKGSEVFVSVKMTRSEFEECSEFVNKMMIRTARVTVINKTTGNNYEAAFTPAHKEFIATLQTELKVDNEMKRVQRPTTMYLYREATSFIYEMGIPVCEIECDYSIDVQQRVPLSPDRDTVDAKYLKTLYGEVLNHTIDEIKPEQSSNLWVRSGFTSDRATSDTRKDVITKRFGEKALIANPNDKRSIDEAISNNFNLIYGSEMSKDEWNVVKDDSLLVSSSSMFKTGIAEGRSVGMGELSVDQINIAAFAKKIATEMLGLDITVNFYDSPGASAKADFNMESSRLRFNVAHFNSDEWKPFTDWKPSMKHIKQEMLDLIIHELGHSRGWHYEHSYHECITELGAKLTLKALHNPKWFEL